MSIASIFSAGLQGVQAGASQVDRAGGRIARMAGATDSSDVAAALVELKVGELQVKASAKVIKAADELLGSLIDIKA